MRKMKPAVSNYLCWLWQGQYTQDLIRKFQWTLLRHLINSIQLQMSKDIMIFRRTRSPGQLMASEAGPHWHRRSDRLTWPGQQAAGASSQRPPAAQGWCSTDPVPWLLRLVSKSWKPSGFVPLILLLLLAGVRWRGEERASTVETYSLAGATAQV